MQHLQQNSTNKQQQQAVPSSRHVSAFTPPPPKKEKREKNQKIKKSKFQPFDLKNFYFFCHFFVLPTLYALIQCLTS
jgi:hypothetical protein